MKFRRILSLIMILALVLGALPLPTLAAKDDIKLSTNKTTYEYGENIVVTASGSDCWVGLYGADETPGKISSYFWYYTSVHNGTAVAIQTTNNNNRTAVLDPGSYKVHIFQGGNSFTPILTVNITVKEPSGDFSLTTDKNSYEYGEDIMVTASGTNCWVGIYEADDSYGKNGENSFCYFYTKDYPGTPVAIQKTTANDRFTDLGSVLPAGKYVVRLFQTIGTNDYNLKSSKEISVVPGDLEDLLSIRYSLDNATDGFANGTVTVTKSSTNSATDCLLYWADANGDPLPGYTALAKFKLTGTTTVHEMYHHTIIPQGAKKLIAYAVQQDMLSNGYVSADLPSDCAFPLPSTYLAEFQMVSDTHVRDASHAYSLHFAQMLEDVRLYSPNSLGIFINGDVTDNGTKEQYETLANLHKAAANNGLTAKIHIAIGNHDWSGGNPNNLFQTYAKKLNSSLTSQPENVYYSETVGGYGFVYLGGESNNINAILSDEQMRWFDAEMAKFTAADPDKPVFVLLHQALYNTVAGTLENQGWHGVVGDNATRLKAVIRKYPQIVLFGGHSHWELNSLECIYPGDATTSTAMNTASVGYLWSSYDVVGGEGIDGSHCYYVRLYEDYVLFMGRSIEEGAFLPSALFLVRRNRISCPDEVTVSLGQKANLGATTLESTTVQYTSGNTSVATVTAGGVITGVKHGTATVDLVALPTDTTVVDRKTVTVNVHDYVNGDCSVCGDKNHTCADGNKDHACDTCKGSMGTHAGTSTSHICSYCGKSASNCVDANTDHSCDICKTGMGNHAGTATSHICTYCGKAASVCSDGSDGDHNCDICGKADITSHTYDQRNTAEAYRICAANCLSPARYYFSCACGQKGTATFEDGSVNSNDHADGCVETWTTSATRHEKKFSQCGKVVVASADHDWKNGRCSLCERLCQHAGGSATCLTLAKCTYCGEEYGQLNGAKHEGELTWIRDAATHKQEYSCCHGTAVSQENHHWVQGVCAECEYSCIHVDQAEKDHNCDLCGMVLGTCLDGNNDNACDYCGGIICAHTGGNATCKTYAVCEKCHKSYGSLESGDHEGTPEWIRTANTHKKAYDCCYAEITPEEAHVDEDEADHVCDVCQMVLGTCSDVAGDMNHNCDICGDPMKNAVCQDKNPADHCCDECGDKLTNCSDAADDEDHNCDTCGKGSITPCSGGTATCRDQAVCETCGEKYGSKDTDNHEGNLVWTRTETTHKYAYDCCGAPVIREEAHVDEDEADHICDVCRLVLGTCADEDGDYVCDVCGEPVGTPPTEPEETEPEETEPEETEPEETEPEETEPEETEPEETEPEETEPEETEPKETEPKPTEPETTEPEATQPQQAEVTRLAGADRFETAFLAADRMKEELGVAWFDAVIVASGANFADALSGSYLAAVKDAPILLSYKQTQNERVEAYILDNLAPNGTVYILGGPAAVPASIEAGLSEYNVVRLAGENRFGTNLAILEEAGVLPGQELLICTGANFADSLSAAATGLPILLVHKKLSDDQKTFLEECPTSRATVIGGMNAVSAELEESVSDLGYSVGRIGGENRFQTSVKIAQTYFEDIDSALLAYAMNFPDGLCGGALAFTLKAPLILTMNGYADQAQGYLAELNPERLVVLGGKDLISERTVETILGETN